MSQPKGTPKSHFLGAIHGDYQPVTVMVHRLKLTPVGDV
jgi:hypothetical protein